MGNRTSYVQLINNTSHAITNTSISGIDNYDWGGNARPDRNLQGLKIPPGGSIERREELNAHASNCPFNMTLTFSDGTVDVFRIHQKFAVGCCEGFVHYTRSHDIVRYRTGDKLVIKVVNTSQQIQNEKAEERNRNGEASLRQKNYEEAIKKFDEALASANQSSTIATIKRNKSEACKELGKISFEKGINLENNTAENKSKEAQQCFERARDMFRQAQTLNNSAENQKNFNLVSLKVDGNRVFNEGNDLEKKGFELFEKAKSGGDFDSAEKKYEEAKVKYEEALKKFEDGMKVDATMFGESAKIAKEVVEEVKKVLEEIDKAELSYNIRKVTVGEEKKEKEKVDQEVNKNIQQQIDVQ